MANRLLIFIFLTISALMQAQEFSVDENKQYVLNFIKSNSDQKVNISDLQSSNISLKDKTLTLYYSENIFVLISDISKANPVLAYSFESNYQQQPLDSLVNFLTGLYSNYSFASGSDKGKKTTPFVHGPLLKAIFGQVNCHDENGNIINVSNIFTPNHVAVGCVAITLATALNYSKWPDNGTGSYMYTDNIGSLRGDHSVEFGSALYDWDNILDRYDYEKTNSTQRMAMAELAYHSAVALSMDFESGGSTSSVSKIPQILSLYFKHYGEYISGDANGFFSAIDGMILKDRVVPLAVYGNGYGHSVVCDGLKFDESGNKYYHLNMGWWGNGNGWYQIHDDFNAGGYSSITGGVFNLVPTPSLNYELNDNIFTLNWNTPDNIAHSGFEVQVKIGRASWTTLESSVVDKFYTTSFNGRSNYAFRVRMIYENFPDLVAWSNMEVFDLSTLGSFTTDSDNLVVYPNPVSQSLYLENLEYESKIYIYNSQACLIKYEEIYNENATIDVSMLNTGVYFLKIEDDFKIYQKKFIKF